MYKTHLSRVLCLMVIQNSPMTYLKSIEMCNIIYWCLLQFNPCVVKSLFSSNYYILLIVNVLQLIRPVRRTSHQSSKMLKVKLTFTRRNSCIKLY